LDSLTPLEYASISWVIQPGTNFQIDYVSGLWGTDVGKATPNKFPVSRPDFRHICMQAGGHFPLFHYKIVSFPAIICLKQLEKVPKSMFLPFQAAKLTQTCSTDLIALLTREITQPVINVLVWKNNLKIMEEYGVMEYLRADSK